MPLVTIDFETFYSDKVGFSKLTTEEYVNHPEFHVIGMGVKVNDGEARWVSGDEAVRRELASFCAANVALLAHNTLFDGAILAWRYGFVPGMYFDTLSMARAIHGVDAGGSLAALATRYKLGAKGDEVINAKGKRLVDFSEEDLARYGQYCINDVELTYQLFNKLIHRFPEQELDIIDMTLRMYTEPVLHVDMSLLNSRLRDIINDKTALLGSLCTELDCTREEVQKKLRSNPQFAALLVERGVAPPTKISATTGKETYALAKNDEGFIALQEHEDSVIQQLCAVRLGTKSTIEESRVKRFIDIGERNNLLLPVPLKYYGAHTGRWAGMDSVNFQNLPSRDKAKKTLKNAVVAPPGHTIINCDSSQIEARVLAWLAGQDDLVEQFANGEDVYSIFASKIFQRTISKEDPIERFVGKTCLAAGTLVLCERGWVRIEQVRLDDKVWDGEEWVCHQGLAYNGLKTTLPLYGIWLTPDHQILCGTEWLPTDTVITSAKHLYQILVTGSERLPSQAMLRAGIRSPRSLSNVDVATNTLGRAAHLKNLIRTLVVSVLAKLRGLSEDLRGSSTDIWKNTITAQGCSLDSALQSHGAIVSKASTTGTMGGEELEYINLGETIEESSCCTSGLLMDGIARNLNWTELTLTADTNPVTYALSLAQRTTEINDQWKSYSQKLPVYDLLSAGPRNRFTVLTDAGPIIVHNCILGLGFGTGAAKLRHTLKTQPPGADLPEKQCDDIVDLYRADNWAIRELWNEAKQVLQIIMAGGKGSLGKHGVLNVDSNGIRLPNGLYIRYPNLRIEDGNTVYNSRKGVVRMWGGVVVENVVQALARCIVSQQMLWINRQYRPVLTVHDAAVLVVPDEELQDALEYVELCMSTTPSWAKGLPIACESGYGKSYGEC